MLTKSLSIIIYLPLPSSTPLTSLPSGDYHTGDLSVSVLFSLSFALLNPLQHNFHYNADNFQI